MIIMGDVIRFNFSTVFDFFFLLKVGRMIFNRPNELILHDHDTIIICMTILPGFCCCCCWCPRICCKNSPKVRHSLWLKHYKIINFFILATHSEEVSHVSPWIYSDQVRRFFIRFELSFVCVRECVRVELSPPLFVVFIRIICDIWIDLVDLFNWMVIF